MKAHPDAKRWREEFHELEKKYKKFPYVQPTKGKSLKCYIGSCRLKPDFDCKEFGNKWAYYHPRSCLVCVTVYGPFKFKPSRESYEENQVWRYGLNPDGSTYHWVEGTDRRFS